MNKLALHGGTPVTKNKIDYSRHLVTRDDVKAVTDVLNSEWLAGRSNVVREFEERIANYTGYKYAVAVNSATSGLYLAMLMLNKDGSRNGMTVTVPALTFVATMNAPLLAGFNVRIKDVNPDTYILDEKESWAIPVSYAGYPVNQLHVVIDAAHELNRQMGNTGPNGVAVISTHAIKPLTTGEGGVVLANNKGVADLIRELSDHGNNGMLYGHNFRMSSLQAALGLSQLERAAEMFAIRREIVAIYRDRLEQRKDLVKLQHDHPSHSNHIFPVILSTMFNRDTVRDALLAEGVRTQIHYKPLHLLRNRHSEAERIAIEKEYPVSESMWNNGLSLPAHNAMTLKDARVVMDALEKVMDSLL